MRVLRKFDALSKLLSRHAPARELIIPLPGVSARQRPTDATSQEGNISDKPTLVPVRSTECASGTLESHALCMQVRFPIQTSVVSLDGHEGRERVLHVARKHRGNELSLQWKGAKCMQWERKGRTRQRRMQ